MDIDINLQNVFRELLPMTLKWKKLAEVIGIDNDEIFTNNERNEECLRAVVDLWMKKSPPTWETVTDFLCKIGEDQLAGSVYHKCKTNCSFLANRHNILYPDADIYMTVRELRPRQTPAQIAVCIHSSSCH